jgi:hypothetical protein
LWSQKCFFKCVLLPQGWYDTDLGVNAVCHMMLCKHSIYLWSKPLNFQGGLLCFHSVWCLNNSVIYFSVQHQQPNGQLLIQHGRLLMMMMIFMFFKIQVCLLVITEQSWFLIFFSNIWIYFTWTCFPLYKFKFNFSQHGFTTSKFTHYYYHFCYSCVWS